MCILSAPVPPKVVTEQKEERLNPLPAGACEALGDHLRRSFRKGSHLGHPGSCWQREVSLPARRWLFPLHQAAS